MSKKSSANEISDNEIDLQDLFRRMGRTLSGLFIGIGRAFLASFVFLVRNTPMLILSLLAGIFISYLLKWTTKPDYVSEITLRSNTLPNTEMISYINKLSLFLKEKNFSGIASALEITQEEAQKINEIEAFWVIDRNSDSIPDFTDYRNSHDVYDSVDVRMKDRFVVRVEMNNPKDFPLMAQKLFNYVDRNPLFRRRNDFRLRTIDELLERLNYDIRQLDSLQKVKYFEETRRLQPEKDGQMVFLQEHSTQLVYDNIYQLYSRKQALDEEKDLHAGIMTLISDFYQPSRRRNGGWYYGKVIIPVCLGLTLIFLILLRNRKAVREVFKRY